MGHKKTAFCAVDRFIRCYEHLNCIMAQRVHGFNPERDGAERAPGLPAGHGYHPNRRRAAGKEQPASRVCSLKMAAWTARSPAARQ